jgi:hypothetical protein
MIGAALRCRVAKVIGDVNLKATLAGGLAALVTAGQALGAVAPTGQKDASDWQQNSRHNDDEDKSKDDVDHNGHHDRGGRPVGYRHDRDPKPSDSDDASAAPGDDSESTDGKDAPSEGDEGEAAPTRGDAAPTEGEAAPTEGEAAPAYDDASGGDNVQEGVAAPAASPMPESVVSHAPPVAAAPSDVDFVS